MLTRKEDLPNVTRVVLLIDGDLLVYRAGFAAEKMMYTTPDGREFERLKQAQHYCNFKLLNPTLITKGREVEPVGNATSNVRNIINAMRKGISKDFNYPVVGVEPIVFLTGCGEKPNFREAIAPEYKANRDPAHKPTHYTEIRDYIYDTYPTVITEGAETDDYLGPAYQDVLKHDPDCQPVIVSIDKDLLCVPGLHYHFVKKEYCRIDELEGAYNFFKQMLVGDTADNIQGVPGIGEVKAAQKLLPLGHSAGLMANLCKERYKQAFKLGWIDKWNANCHMLWIWHTIPDECPWLVDSFGEFQTKA